MFHTTDRIRLRIDLALTDGDVLRQEGRPTPAIDQSIGTSGGELERISRRTELRTE